MSNTRIRCTPYYAIPISKKQVEIIPVPLANPTSSSSFSDFQSMSINLSLQRISHIMPSLLYQTESFMSPTLVDEFTDTIPIFTSSLISPTKTSITSSSSPTVSSLVPKDDIFEIMHNISSTLPTLDIDFKSPIKQKQKTKLAKNDIIHSPHTFEAAKNRNKTLVPNCSRRTYARKTKLKTNDVAQVLSSHFEDTTPTISNIPTTTTEIVPQHILAPIMATTT